VSPADVIVDAPRRADDDLRSVEQRVGLRAHARAAVDGHHAQVLVLAQRLDLLRDLEGKLPRIAQHQRARLSRAGGNAREKRNAEGPLEPEVLEPEAIPEELETSDDEPATALPVPVERDLSRADALQRYMAEVARHPLLSREEEHDVAVKFQKTRDPMLAY